MGHADANVYPGQIFDGRWEVGEHLADGFFSMVFKGVDLATGKDCAIKVLSITKSSADNLVEFERDTELLRKLSTSSNVVNILGAGAVQMPMKMANSEIIVPLDVSYMVLERADGDLSQLLINRTAISWEDRLGLFRNVVKGVHQMHLKYLVHRDLKGDNVLLLRDFSEAVAKLTDLGRGRDTRVEAHFPPSKYEMGRGDLRFAPPEFLWGLGSDDPEMMRLADVYLLGSVLFEIGTGQGLMGTVVGDPLRIVEAKHALRPSDRQSDFEGARTQLQRDHELAYELFRRELPRSIQAEGTALLRLLTMVDPSKREPQYISRSPSNWDLQWILKRIDRIVLQLRIDERRRSRLPWKRKGATSR